MKFRKSGSSVQNGPRTQRLPEAAQVTCHRPRLPNHCSRKKREGLLTETLANPQAIFRKTSNGMPSGTRIHTLRQVLSLSRARLISRSLCSRPRALEWPDSPKLTGHEHAVEQNGLFSQVLGIYVRCLDYLWSCSHIQSREILITAEPYLFQCEDSV